MPVQEHGLRSSQRTRGAIQVSPASLHHPDLWVLEVPDQRGNEVSFGDEVRVENRDELTLGGSQPVPESTRFESLALGAPHHVDPVSAGAEVAGHAVDDSRSLVGRIIEDLNLQPVRRIVDRSGRSDQSFRDVPLVVHGQLHGHDRRVLRQLDNRLGVLPHQQHRQAQSMAAVQNEQRQCGIVDRV